LKTKTLLRDYVVNNYKIVKFTCVKYSYNEYKLMDVHGRFESGLYTDKQSAVGKAFEMAAEERNKLIQNKYEWEENGIVSWDDLKPELDWEESDW
jgi:hypothetical protein